MRGDAFDGRTLVLNLHLVLVVFTLVRMILMIIIVFTHMNMPLYIALQVYIWEVFPGHVLIALLGPDFADVLLSYIVILKTTWITMKPYLLEVCIVQANHR